MKNHVPLKLSKINRSKDKMTLGRECEQIKDGSDG